MSKNFELIQEAELNLNTDGHSDLRVPLQEELVQASIRTKVKKNKRKSAARGFVDNVTREESMKLVQSVFLQHLAEPPRCVVFAGIDHGNGCSQICAQSAEILADHVPGSVCVVEANLRTPSLPEFFGTTNHHGLTDALLHSDSIKNYAKQLPAQNLWLLSSGSTQPRGRNMLNSEQMKTRLLELRSQFDYLVIDAPPINEYSDAISLGELADGLILVLEANATRRESALRVAETLRSTKIRVIGAVLNKRTFPIPETLYNLL
jgi:receptor protein-tyrosine kinase